MTASKKTGRFYKIRELVGEKCYELTDDIHIPPMGIDARNAWRIATYQSLSAAVVDARTIQDGVIPEYIDRNEAIERALLGDQYDACKELFADDARAWDVFLTELRDFNKVADTPIEDAPGN